MIGRRRRGKHLRSTQEVLREIKRDLPAGIAAAEISDVAMAGFATLPEGANLIDFDWGIAYSPKEDEWAVIVAERTLNGVPPLVTRVSNKEIGIYICHVHHYVKEEMREHAKQKQAEEDSKSGDVPAGDPEGKDHLLADVPVPDGTRGVQAPWPRVAHKDV